MIPTQPGTIWHELALDELGANARFAVIDGPRFWQHRRVMIRPAAATFACARHAKRGLP